LELPLFIHAIPPRVIIIINDEIIENEPIRMSELHCTRMLTLLIEIYKIEKYRNKIPLVLHEYLKDSLESNGPCLTGDDDYWPPFCLNFEMEAIQEDSDKVLLTNITYNGEPIKKEIELDVKDYFSILANLSVQWMAQSERPLDEVEKDVIERKELNAKKSDIDRSDYFLIEDFAFSYLMYVRKELEERRIEPIEILRNGGSYTLVYLKEEESVARFINEARRDMQLSSTHTKKHKLIVDCFYECLDYEEL